MKELNQEPSNISDLDNAVAIGRCDRRDAKMEKILDAALSAFLETGYGASSMDQISAAAGVSKATVYTRFPSKQELFAAVVARECRACTRRMGLSEHHPDLNIEQALRRVAESLLDIFTLPRNLAIMRLVIGEYPRFPELGTVMYDSGPAVTLQHLSEFLDIETKAGRLRVEEPVVAAQYFISLLRGDIHVRALLGAGDLSPAARGRAASRAVDVFLRLYGV